MAYVKTVKQNGMLAKKAIKRVYEETVSTDPKDFVRKSIEDEVFDIDDAVADNAKMISLITTVLSRIYGALDTATLDNLDANDKGMIEYMFAKFAATNTRADVQFATEGVSLIDKLLDRQGIIGNIVATKMS